MLINDLVELGVLIRRRRIELRLSQTDLAEQTGTTRQWISRLEKGKNDIGTARLLAVLDVLELNLEIRPPRFDSALKFGQRRHLEAFADRHRYGRRDSSVAHRVHGHICSHSTCRSRRVGRRASAHPRGKPEAYAATCRSEHDSRYAHQHEARARQYLASTYSFMAPT